VNLQALSPTLREFLRRHPDGNQMVAELFDEATKSRTVTLYYIYTANKSVPPAVHYSDDPSNLVVVVKESLQPLDQLICVVFELVNAENDAAFRQINHDAALGEISRENYPIAILREEFRAISKTRILLSHLKISKREKAKSERYKELMEFPREMDAYIAYERTVFSPGDRDVFKYYELQYDKIRQSAPAALSPEELMKSLGH
jgi:hypothetical protein